MNILSGRFTQVLPYPVLVVAVHDIHRFLMSSFKSQYSFGCSLSAILFPGGSLAVVPLAVGRLFCSCLAVSCLHGENTV